MRRHSSRSLGRWLSWWLGVQTLTGLALVCIAVYVATSLNFAARQDEELRHKQEVIRHLVGEIAVQADLASLRRPTWRACDTSSMTSSSATPTRVCV